MSANRLICCRLREGNECVGSMTEQVLLLLEGPKGTRPDRQYGGGGRDDGGDRMRCLAGQ
jgi:hypothetical protein